MRSESNHVLRLHRCATRGISCLTRMTRVHRAYARSFQASTHARFYKELNWEMSKRPLFPFNLSTSCVRTACPKLQTNLEQAVLKQLVTILLILLDLLQGTCYNLVSSTL